MSRYASTAKPVALRTVWRRQRCLTIFVPLLHLYASTDGKGFGLKKTSSYGRDYRETVTARLREALDCLGGTLRR